VRVSTDGHSGGSVVLLMPKAKGFKPDDEVDSRTVQPVNPGFAKQDYLFFKHTNQNFPVSEVFFRFDGQTPWKKLGEVVSTTGDFKEAVRAQWTLFIEHSYYLSRKARFWLPTEHPIRFGYTDEQAEIVTVEEGPLPEAMPPLELKEMLKRCGFHKEPKPKHWRHMHTNAKDLDVSKKDFHRKKPHLIHRARNAKLIAHKWYNPDKYRGPYTAVMRKKRGLVVGQGPSR